jgi:exodeoxyribonuclease VII small subunit
MPKSSSKKVEKAVEELAYEEALAELEEIVTALEGEQNRLEEAIKLFERGQALAARCGVLLEAAELKVRRSPEMRSSRLRNYPNESFGIVPEQCTHRGIKRLGACPGDQNPIGLPAHAALELGLALHIRRHAKLSFCVDDGQPSRRLYYGFDHPIASVWRSP